MSGGESCYLMNVSFFFSSRRRHMGSYGDWSSGVCSSDLGPFFFDFSVCACALILLFLFFFFCFRSEERRAGKEGKSRWAPDH